MKHNNNNENRLRVAITQGDFNGIGLEVIAKALSGSDVTELFTPIIYGDAHNLEAVKRKLHLDDFHYEVIGDPAKVVPGKVNVIDIYEENDEWTPGKPTEASGRGSVAALEAAVQDIRDGYADVLVTAPIDKRNVQGHNFDFPGHTEYLESRFGLKDEKALMVMVSGPLRVALVTTHLPLAEVPGKITRERVADAIRNFNRVLRQDFACERPRIAVLSLNPHCGDGGLLGSEEQTDIIPAIEQCKAEGILAFGPVAADGLFGTGGYSNFDGILAMYHDQGLAPFKALARDGGVNFTGGLEVVRTSPAHGTAFNIAGRGIADEASMRAALYEAIDIWRTRRRFREAAANPLPIRERQQREPRNRQQRETNDTAPSDLTEE